MKIACYFAEPGRPPDQRAISNVARYFPDAEICWESELLSRFDEAHPRWGYRMNDYHKATLMLGSNADIAIAWDADMEIVSEKVRSILHLTKRFGLCIPANPRGTVELDTRIGADSDRMLDETQGTGHALNCTPIALNLHHPQAVAAVRAFCRIMLENPVRGPLAWWRAFYETGFSPCLLPFQWCVSAGQEGLGGEIVLHVGHEQVRRHYAHSMAS